MRELRPSLSRGRLIGGLLGLSGLVALAVGAAVDFEHACRAYLWAFLWLCSLPLGALAFLMIHHATGGRWGQALFPLLRAAVATTPLLLLFFVPVGLSLPELYAWARPEEVLDSRLWQHRAGYLNPTAYWLRSVGGFLIWSYLAWRLQTAESSPATQKAASAGLVAHLLLTGLLSVDWLMSLEEHFISTIFGLLLMVLQAVSGYALMVSLACWRQRRLGEEPEGAFYDLGGLLLASVMLLSYLSFSQVVIIWSGNLSEEIPWMVSRVWGPWKWVAAGLLAFQLFFPFLCLIWGKMKREAGRLGLVAALVAALAPLHFYWMVMPSYHPDELAFHWTSAAALCALAGLWWVAFTSFWFRLEKR